jgi:hypothetical protein
MLRLPRTLAACGDATLEDVLNHEFPQNALPMEAFLERGGWPEQPRLRLRGVNQVADGWELLLTLSFTELCPAACPASHWPEQRQGYVRLVLRSDATATLQLDP